MRYADSVTRIRLFAVLLLTLSSSAQKQEFVWSDQERPVADEIRNIRNLPDDIRAATTRDLAWKIRGLPAAPAKLRLAMGLAGRATEGDFGRDTLQEVAKTLEMAIQEQTPAEPGAYRELASLVRYEHVQAALDSPRFDAAMNRLEAEDRERNSLDFTLADVHGKSCGLRELRGKVVLLNFWATWCPPCRKEIPDLETLYQRFRSQGFVVLGISDDEPSKVRAFVREHAVTYPVLLDPGSKVNQSFQVDGIPKSFLYDRQGRVAATAMDMRTGKQLREMLEQAGLR
jgi:peroxiredoxin